MTRHHALGAALGLLLGLLFFGLANGLLAGAAAISTGEIPSPFTKDTDQ